MQSDENNGLKNSIRKLLSDDNSDKLIIKALSCIKPSQRRMVILCVLFIFLFVVFMLFFNKQENAVTESLNIFKLVDGIALPTLGIAVTGYAIFQALATGETLITLLKASNKEYSKFQEYNYFFLAFSVLFLFIVIFNFIFGIVIGSLDPKSYIPFLNKETNTVFYDIAISLYITFVVNALIEIKSFIYNLYQIFSTNAAAIGIEHLKKNKKKDT